jgi:hypothetical protein
MTELGARCRRAASGPSSDGPLSGFNLTNADAHLQRVDRWQRNDLVKVPVVPIAMLAQGQQSNPLAAA